MSSDPPFPFDHDAKIGVVLAVGPTEAKVTLPPAIRATGQWHHGSRLGMGEVGEFVVIEVEQTAVLGRILHVRLAEREKGELLSGSVETGSAPVATVQLVSTLELSSGKVLRGISQYPRIGAPVYAAVAEVLDWAHQSIADEGESDLIHLGQMAGSGRTSIKIRERSLFARHCAVLGATGGGKSWTVARLLEELGNTKTKVILLDPTGEYWQLKDEIKHAIVGRGHGRPEKHVVVSVPYHQLVEGDLFAMFQPRGLSQAPKLRAAIKSLKLGRCAPALMSDGLLKKAGSTKAPVDAAAIKYAQAIQKSEAEFDIDKLALQIHEECVYPTDFNSTKKWGKTNESELSYCITLITRIEDMINSPSLKCIFKPDAKSVFDEIKKFLRSDKNRILRISMEGVPYEHNAREIIVNAIGRWLLHVARDGQLPQQRIIVFLDEAHQFLNKQLGEEGTQYSLDAFGLIAKEGRKYGLNVTVATQRPRDIPEDVLSQIGTLVVHRLTNEHDRRVVESASGDLDKGAASFLPVLAPGEAILVGVDLPSPVPIIVTPPRTKPDPNPPIGAKAAAPVADAQETKDSTTMRDEPIEESDEEE